MYIKRNSFDGEFCIFNTTNFKRLFNSYKEKTGLTKVELLEQIAENIGSAEETISGWLQGKSPSNDTISKDSKLNENAIIVRLAKFFEVNVKELLKFPKKEGEKKMNIIKNSTREAEKYNDYQKKALYHLNNVIMEYMILKCHIMDKHVDAYNFMEYFDYSKFANEKFERPLPILEGSFEGGKADYSPEEKGLKYKYGVEDVNEACEIDMQCDENSNYGYVLFEIEKASTLLRKDFINKLEIAIKNLYEIYDFGFMPEETDTALIESDEEREECKNLGIEKNTDYVKYLFSKEFSLYC